MVPCITGWARFLSKVSLITEFPIVAAFNLRLYFALWLVHNTKIKIINMPWNTLKPTSHRIMTVSSDMAALMKLGSTPSVKICIKYRKHGRYSFSSTTVSWPPRAIERGLHWIFYKTEMKIWAVGCGLGWTVLKKGLGRLWATFLACFFTFSGSKKIFKIFLKTP